MTQTRKYFFLHIRFSFYIHTHETSRDCKSPSWAISIIFLLRFRSKRPEMQRISYSGVEQAIAEHVARGCPVGQTGPQTYGRLFVDYSERRFHSGCLSWDLTVISPIIKMGGPDDEVMSRLPIGYHWRQLQEVSRDKTQLWTAFRRHFNLLLSVNDSHITCFQLWQQTVKQAYKIYWQRSVPGQLYGINGLSMQNTCADARVLAQMPRYIFLDKRHPVVFYRNQLNEDTVKYN